jgi:hypothetical protein
MTLTPTTYASAINTQLGDQGLAQQPWWVEQWMELINSGARLGVCPQRQCHLDPL